MSWFDISVLASFGLNAILCGFITHRLWRRDNEERLARESSQSELKEFLAHLSACVQTSADRSYVALTKNLTEAAALQANILRTHLSEVRDHNTKCQSEVLSLLNQNVTVLAETLRPVIDWCYIVEKHVAETRSRQILNPAGETVSDTCEHCKCKVNAYFIDGYGRVTCKACKPEGFRDAVNRGVARL